MRKRPVYIGFIVFFFFPLFVYSKSFPFASSINAQVLGSAVIPLDLTLLPPDIQIFTDKSSFDQEWWYAVWAIFEDDFLDSAAPWTHVTEYPVTVKRWSGIDSNTIQRESQMMDASHFMHVAWPQLMNKKAYTSHNSAAVQRTIQFKTKETTKFANIRTLNATMEASGVRLEYTSEAENQEITIFRSMRPLESLDSLKHTHVVGTKFGKTGTLWDAPLSDILWYYGAVDSALYNRNNSQWMDFAAFSQPIYISYNEYHAFVRTTPLPQLRISRRFSDGVRVRYITGDLPFQEELNSEIRDIISEKIGIRRHIDLPTPETVVLDVDRVYSENAYHEQLQPILKGSFAKKNWRLAGEELFVLSATQGIPDDIWRRIQFYRGQVQYFSGQYYQAFLSFVVAADKYFLESRQWMLRIYSEIIPVS